MLRLGLYSVALLLSVMIVSPVTADVIPFSGGPVAPTPGNAWQGITMNGAQTINTTTAYWNHDSADLGFLGAGKLDMGNYMAGVDNGFLAGTGTASLGFAPGDVQWWGNTTGGIADPNMEFVTGAGGLDGTNLRLEFAGNAPNNEFGYYLTSAPGTLIKLYDGSATVGAVNFFLPVGDFGFYLKNTDNGNIFRSDETGTPGDQHFAAFRDTNSGFPNSIWIGVEDLPFGTVGCDPKTAPAGTCADRDYQDMIVRIDAVPEPATLLLVGSSLLVLGFAGVRARRRS